ncbi:hypothetical protein ASG70_12190 [Phycicoccus sp. Soil748]|nr:hypothetical protein ASG70_12190 [Phycicoccus sp. Soil748]
MRRDGRWRSAVLVRDLVGGGTLILHGIGAEVEVISADQVNEANQRVLASDVRYRFVIDTATLA